MHMHSTASFTSRKQNGGQQKRNRVVVRTPLLKSCVNKRQQASTGVNKLQPSSPHYNKFCSTTESPTNTTGTGTEATEPGTEATESGTNGTESGTEAVESGTSGTESGTEATESGTEATESGTGSTESGTEGTESGTEATESGTDSTESDTEGTESGTEATESGTDSTESDTEATESGTEATESGTEATESGTEATESGTEGTESGTEATESGTEASESGTEASESGTEATESGTEATESGTEATESGTEATESGTEATESGTEATESGTEATESGTEAAESGTDGTESATDDTVSGTEAAESGTEATESGTEATESGTEATESGTDGTESATDDTVSGTEAAESGTEVTESGTGGADTTVSGTSAPESSTVSDTDAPVVTCSGNVPSVTAGFGSVSAVVSWLSMPSATDNVDTIDAGSITCQDNLDNTVVSGGTYAVGVTTVTCRVSDAALNEGSCQFTITVTACGLTASSCANGGTFDAQYCECVCPQTHSGATCGDTNPCLTSPGALCSDATSGQYCQPSSDAPGYTCQCRNQDGYFMVSTACLRRPTIVLTFRAPLEVFIDAYRNPTSTAFRAKIAILKRLILLRLRNSASTASVVSVSVLILEPGSVISTVAVEFPENQVLPRAGVVSALSSGDLTDGTETVSVDPASVTVQDATTECAPNYCSNGGVCVRSGYFPNFVYTCSCQTSFTGQRCETIIPVPVDPSTVPEPPSVTLPPQGGLSTLAIILIVVGFVLLLLLIVGLFLCFMFFQSQRYARPLPVYRSRRKPVTALVPVDYDDYQTLPHDAYRRSEINRDDIRMESLRRVIIDSPYLKQGLTGQQDFIRPYVVTGMEGVYNDYPMYDGSSAGRVVYNPGVF
ncbi:mucin-22-like isoform X2 [Patiria miniata]|uniref:Uncharacterized protein n=1 Tax=Patiria miniata TaxID=46514 RepID=A0A913Z2T0_PATMI|nr:mucin-22-like isoform X2 [Patiria miniata]